MKFFNSGEEIIEILIDGKDFFIPANAEFETTEEEGNHIIRMCEKDGWQETLSDVMCLTNPEVTPKARKPRAKKEEVKEELNLPTPSAKTESSKVASTKTLPKTS